MDQVLKRFDMLEAQMAAGPDTETYIRLASDYSEIQEMAGRIRELQAAEAELSDLEAMLSDNSTDGEMRALAEAEIEPVQERIAALEAAIQILLLPRDAADDRNAILEIRAGTGGDEAALFAGNLARMYERYASNQGWRFEIVSASEGERGGYKEVIATVSGKGVFSRFKFESGVHRVQRVPETEASGRIHTSAATVAVLPEAEEVDIEIRNEDIRIDTMRASGAGGQHVNTTDSAVRISRPGLSSSRPKSRNTRTGRAPCRSCGRGCSISSGPRLPTSAPSRAGSRLGPATGRNGSVHIIFRRDASPIIAST